jgi:hypothetical protein
VFVAAWTQEGSAKVSLIYPDHCVDKLYHVLSSLETFQLDATGDQLKIECSFEYELATYSYTRYFSRIPSEETGGSNRSNRSGNTNRFVAYPSLRFQACETSQGWLQRDFTKSEFLASLKVEITGAVTLNSNNNAGDVSSCPIYNVSIDKCVHIWTVQWNSAHSESVPR